MGIKRNLFLFFILAPFAIVFNIIAKDNIIELGQGMFSIPDFLVQFLLVSLFIFVLVFLVWITNEVFSSSRYQLASKVFTGLTIIFIASAPYVYSSLITLINTFEKYRYKTNTSLNSYEQTVHKSDDGMVERIDFSFTIDIINSELYEAIVYFNIDSNYVFTRMSCSSSTTAHNEKEINYISWKILKDVVMKTTNSSVSIISTTSNSGISGLIPFFGNSISCKGGYMFAKPYVTRDRNDSLPIKITPNIRILLTKEHFFPLEGVLANFMDITLDTDGKYEQVYNQSDVNVYEDYRDVENMLKNMYEK